MYVHACIQVPCSRALITSLSIYSSENASFSVNRMLLACEYPACTTGLMPSDVHEKNDIYKHAVCTLCAVSLSHFEGASFLKSL